MLPRIMANQYAVTTGCLDNELKLITCHCLLSAVNLIVLCCYSLCLLLMDCIYDKALARLSKYWKFMHMEITFFMLFALRVHSCVQHNRCLCECATGMPPATLSALAYVFCIMQWHYWVEGYRIIIASESFDHVF